MLNIVYASTLNGGIGYKGKLPWHCPEDLAIFKTLTLGCPVIMGSRTWDSLPVKPLPGRHNTVVSSHASMYKTVGEVYPELRADAFCATLKEAVDFAPMMKIRRGNDQWVIGGKRLIEEAYPLASYLHHTEIHPHSHNGDFQCDVFVEPPGDIYLAIDEIMVESVSGMRIIHTTYHNAAQPTDPDYEETISRRIREALRSCRERQEKGTASP